MTIIKDDNGFLSVHHEQHSHSSAQDSTTSKKKGMFLCVKFQDELSHINDVSKGVGRFQILHNLNALEHRDASIGILKALIK